MAFSILLCVVWVGWMLRRHIKVRETGWGRQEPGGSGLDLWVVGGLTSEEEIPHSLSTSRRHLTAQRGASGRLNNDDCSRDANRYSLLATSVPASLVPENPNLEPTLSIL
ncbi:hypothetical protein BKA70DRAFT_193341 [Coprinopsis sp. MPI-PUGE-AT-0042]|nr:hypothetical protein BKA70DRAFT_193341 [Coprinopsis sp. MPI-PUGE-AT-0042]